MNRDCSQGFTLIELVVTLSIVGLLATMISPLTSVSVIRIKEQDLSRNLKEIRTAIDQYKEYAERGFIQRTPGDSGYPESLKVLVEGVTNIKDPEAKKIYFLRRMPGDPFNKNGVRSNELSWGLRAYDSEWDDPQPGDDVYDVYSTSTNVGLNGVIYREW